MENKKKYSLTLKYILRFNNNIENLLKDLQKENLKELKNPSKN